MTPKELFRSHLACKWKTIGTDFQYSVIKSGMTVRLDICGSNSVPDWISNLDFAVAAYKRMPRPWLAHRGFLKAWHEVNDKVCAEVSALMSPGDEVLVVGYSRGGALATLAHEDLRFRGFACDTHAFGSPRVLWFPAEWLRGRFQGLHRYSVRGDPVTRLAPAAFGYSHVGELHLYGRYSLPLPSRHLSAYYLDNM